MPKTVAQFIDHALHAYSGSLTQTEIARAAGFANPNFLSMIKSGRARLPLGRVRALCGVLGVEAEELLILVASEAHPEPENNPLWIMWGGRIPTAVELRSIR